MDTVLWIAAHWEQIASTAAMAAGLVAHIQAGFGIGGKTGQVMDLISGNYNKRSTTK